jgi:aryl-alcohol dehydrogenase
MKITAAVVKEKSGRFLLEEAELDPPRSQEVLVRIVATGICHTDMVVRNQQMPTPLPIVLGHEGAGIVEAVGDEVTEVAVGDHVVLTFGYCGKCSSCRQGLPSYCEHQMECNFGGSRIDGSHRVHQESSPDLHDSFFSQSSFATHAIAHENNTVKVPRDVPLELLGPLGCGIQTGAGAVLNSLNVPAGASIAIFGTGAVGLAAIMASRVAGATTIIAVDINDERLALARELGATHSLNSRQGGLVEQIQQLTDGGTDFAFDTTGRPDVVRAAVQALRTHGVCGLVGVTAPDKELSFGPNDIMVMGRTVKGILQGDSVPSIFIPRMIALYQQGQFPFDRLVKFYDFDQINQAAEDAERGTTIKPVLRIGTVAA